MNCSRRSREKIERELRHGPEGAALDEDGLLIQHVGGLDHFARRGEHCRVGQPLLHQLQAHEPVVHAVEGGTRELDHVHVDAPRARELIHERADEGLRLRMTVVRAVDQIDAQHAEGPPADASPSCP